MTHNSPACPQAVIGVWDNSPPIYLLSMTFYYLEYFFGPFRSPVLAVLPHGFFSICMVAEHEKMKSLDLD